MQAKTEHHINHTFNQPQSTTNIYSATNRESGLEKAKFMKKIPISQVNNSLV